MSERNGSAATALEERVATLEAEVAAVRTANDKLRREVEELRGVNVHNQEGWISPGDPRGRVQG